MTRIRGPVRQIICANIRACRMKRFPGRGGSKKCAETFGVSQQQWSPWETGSRTPDEFRLAQLADFFGVTVEYLCQEHAENGSIPVFAIPRDGRDAGDGYAPRPAATGLSACPFHRLPHSGPGSNTAESQCLLAERFFGAARELNVSFKLASDDINHVLKPLLPKMDGP